MRLYLLIPFLVFMLPAAHAELEMSTFLINFQDQPVDGPIQTSAVWITNTGPKTETLNVNSTCYSGFQVDSLCDEPLEMNMTCTVYVRFQPWVAGYQTCQISVSDADGETEYVNVMGRGD